MSEVSMSASARDQSCGPDAPVGEWQPIETAPKDGSRFLAFGRAYGELRDDGYSWGTADVDRPREPFTCIISWFELWYDSEVEAGDGLYRKERTLSCAYWKPHSHAFRPTHWMPLPEPPKP